MKCETKSQRIFNPTTVSKYGSLFSWLFSKKKKLHQIEYILLWIWITFTLIQFIFCNSLMNIKYRSEVSFDNEGLNIIRSGVIDFWSSLSFWKYFKSFNFVIELLQFFEFLWSYIHISLFYSFSLKSEAYENMENRY